MKKGIFFGIFCAISISLMLFFAKIATKHTNVFTIVFFRFSICFFCISLIVIFKKLRNKGIHLKTKHIHLHILRAFVSFVSMFFLYLSLKYIPVVDGNLLIMTSPFFIPIIGVIFFQSKLDFKHLLFVVIGFVGVAFVLKPGHELFEPMSLFALFSGVLISINFIIIKTVNKHDEHYTSLFYYFLFSFIISFFVSVFYLKVYSSFIFFILIVAGIFGFFSQYFIIRSSKYLGIKISSSLLYLSIIFSITLSYLFLKEHLGLLSAIGVFLICSSGLLTVLIGKRKTYG